MVPRGSITGHKQKGAGYEFNSSVDQCVFRLAVAVSVHASHCTKGEPCDSKPRWLLVTVLERNYYHEPKDGGAWEQDGTLSSQTPKGELAMIDRCGSWGRPISMIKNRTPTKPGKTLIVESHDVDGESKGATHYFIKESLTDLCRAMKDCADATSSSP